MIISRTPYRISFFGAEITRLDNPVENRGKVLNATINKYCNISLKRTPSSCDFKHKISYSKTEVVNLISEINHPVVKRVMEDFSKDFKNQGYEIQYTSELPTNSGVGSLSAFTVGIINLFCKELGIEKNKKELANYAIKLLQNIYGEQIASQDQIATTFGGFNQINFKKGRQYDVERIKIDYDRLNLLNSHLLLFYSGLDTFELVTSEQGDLQNTYETEKLKFTEKIMDRALNTLQNKNTDIKEFGFLLNENWNYICSISPEIKRSISNHYFDRAYRNGALGGKILGGREASFILFFAPEICHSVIIKELPELVHIPFQFETNGSHIIEVKNR